MQFLVGSTGPVIAALVVRKRRKLIRAFQAAGATSAATARTIADLGLSPDFIFAIQKRRRVVVDAGGGRFYLDEAREGEVRRTRRTVAAIVVVCAVIALAVVLVAR